MSSLSPGQVLFLTGLSLTLGDNHLVRWELPAEEYQRFDCYPEDNADESKCVERGCIWKVSTGGHFSVWDGEQSSSDWLASVSARQRGEGTLVLLS